MTTLKKLVIILMCLVKKSYNGVAIITKVDLQKINKSFIKDELKQSRVISGEIQLKKKKIELINIYVPNGNPIDTDKYTYKEKLVKKIFNQH